ncbi:MAG: DUF2961 domain-containing protein [Candidatus Hydrogenedentes bacterium]|nr:DUF2961 domain-containing protein [Candidatus Hydrogenedentota bacterium]
MYRRIVALALLALLGALNATAWTPVGGLNEIYDDTLAPALRPGVVLRSFSSYDRTGGNDDGFSGAYSKLREENGNSVLAEMNGPGCIYRIWFTHTSDLRHGLLEGKGEHIRIYLDGSTEPALDEPIEDLFNGKHPRFPRPLAGQGLGGFYCYVPIAYRSSCKVEVDGPGVHFYQINYATFPSAEGVENFPVSQTDAEAQALKRAVKRWNDPVGQLHEMGLKKLEQDFSFSPGSPPVTVSLAADAPPEAHVVYGLILEGVPEAVIQAGRIRILRDDATLPDIDIPLAYFFGRAFSPTPHTTLFFGHKYGLYYNRLPLVFEKRLIIEIKPGLTCEGSIQLLHGKASRPASELGRLHAQYNESLPTVEGVLHPFLKKDGRGHYLGTYLVTEGPQGLPFWLEGDDQWQVDGELRIHGTGSEDYFNCGWYALRGRLNDPAAMPSHGFPIYGEMEATMRAAAYRWHFGDPVPFETHIDVGIEHGEANKHVADYRSVAFYYLAP